MAASFWESTQRRFWIFTRDELAKTRSKLREDEQALVAMFPLPEWRHLSIYFNQRWSPLLIHLFGFTEVESLLTLLALLRG
jgi:hypothetical protein